MQHCFRQLCHSLLIAACGWLAMLSLASADTLVVPTGLENVEGNTSNAGPFGKFLVESNDPFRTQQIYSATAFTPIGDVIVIEELRFRQDGPNGSTGPVTANDIEIRFSTTQKPVDGLDNTDLDLNVDGADETLVYAGSLTLQSCDCGTPTRAFDVVVDLQTPFVYDPTLGNLLLDVLNTSNPYPLAFFLDAHDNTIPNPDDPADEIARLAEVIDNMDNHLILGGAISLGLVTQFVYTVPEPSAALAGVVAVLGMLALRRAA